MAVISLFEDESFDTVFSKDAITETPNKEDILLESYRVLRPASWVAMSGWFRGSAPFTPEMKEWIKEAGVAPEMTTLDDTADQLRKTGFADVLIEDRNEWYQDYSKREAKRMAGENRHRFERLLGEEETDIWIPFTGVARFVRRARWASRR